MIHLYRHIQPPSSLTLLHLKLSPLTFLHQISPHVMITWLLLTVTIRFQLQICHRTNKTPIILPFQVQSYHCYFHMKNPSQTQTTMQRFCYHKLPQRSSNERERRMSNNKTHPRRQSTRRNSLQHNRHLQTTRLPQLSFSLNSCQTNS